MNLFHSKRRQWLHDVNALAASNARTPPSQWPRLLPALDQATDRYLRDKGIAQPSDQTLATLMDRPAPGLARSLGLMTCAHRMSPPALAALEQKHWHALHKVVRDAPYGVGGHAFSAAWEPVTALVATRQDAAADSELLVLSLVRDISTSIARPGASASQSVERILNCLLQNPPPTLTQGRRLLEVQLQHCVNASVDGLLSTTDANALERARHTIEQVRRAHGAGLAAPRFTPRWNAWCELLATRETAITWGGVGPLPPNLQEKVAAVAPGAINALLDLVGGLHLPQKLRQSLWTEGLEMVLGAPTPLPASAGRNEPFTCAICAETKPPEQRAKLDGCACEPAGCTDCTREAIRLAEAAKQMDHCPTLCGAPLTRRGLERLGMPVDEVNHRIARVMQGKLGTLPDWSTCETADCNGGRQVAMEGSAFSCQLCTTVNSGKIPTDEAILRKLVGGFGAFPADVLEDGDGLTRECYHCGIPTEKEAGCQHMACTSCGGDWHFVNGPYHGDNEYEGNSAQRFRPRRNGILGRLGFYAGIPAGRLSKENQQLLLKRASDWKKNGPPQNVLDASDDGFEGQSESSEYDSDPPSEAYESDWVSESEYASDDDVFW